MVLQGGPPVLGLADHPETIERGVGREEGVAWQGVYSRPMEPERQGAERILLKSEKTLSTHGNLGEGARTRNSR